MGLNDNLHRLASQLSIHRCIYDREYPKTIRLKRRVNKYFARSQKYNWNNSLSLNWPLRENDSVLERQLFPRWTESYSPLATMNSPSGKTSIFHLYYARCTRWQMNHVVNLPNLYRYHRESNRWLTRRTFEHNVSRSMETIGKL